MDLRRSARLRPDGIVIVLAAVLALVVPRAQATTLVRVDELPALVAESRRALLATVTGVRHGFDERRLHATFVQLRVEDPLYGDAVPQAGEELAIKIYGSPDTMENGTRVFIDGTPRYSIGDRYLLLLREDSPWGFTNVAGLFQGAFRVTAAGEGAPMAESLAGNRSVFREAGLSRWLEPSEVTPEEAAFLNAADGPVPYSLLRKAVVRLWTEKGGRP